MADPVLVTYATRYGSTQEVAEVVAATLREAGLAVEIQRMRDVKTLDGYGAVVMGAPIYIGRLHRDAQNFLATHCESLLKRRVALFALGPTRPDAQEWAGVRDQLAQEMLKYAWLKLVSHELFGGKYDPEKLRFPDNMLARLPVTPLHDMPASDVRDWEAIRAWAGSLVEKLQPEFAR